MNQKSFSVIVPTLGSPPSLLTCLDALYAQSLPLEEIEIIVVLNGISGTSRQRRLHPRVKWVEQAQLGSYRARNTGVRASGAKNLAFTDDDCVPDEKWLESGLQRLKAQANGEPPPVVGGAIDITTSASPTGSEIYEMLFGLDQHHYVLSQGFAATANLQCTRDTFLSVGPFRDDLLSGGDLEWGNRARRRGFRLEYCPSVRVSHPARCCYRDLLAKAHRVAEGRSKAKSVYQVKTPWMNKLKHRTKLRAHLFQALKHRSGMGLLKAFGIFLRLRWAETLQRPPKLAHFQPPG